MIVAHILTPNTSIIILYSTQFPCDGNRFLCNEAYRNLRETSDRLCKEHGLSIIENRKEKTEHEHLQMEQAGMPTRYNIARQAIDEAVSLSLNMEEFAA